MLAKLKESYLRWRHKEPMNNVLHLRPPQNPKEKIQMTNENNRVVTMIEDLDRQLSNLKYLPEGNKSPIEAGIRKRKARLFTHHMLMVMALNGNPHLAARTVEERNEIVRATMKLV